MVLSKEQRERYARQLLLPEMAEAGQEGLAQGSVLIIGLGGLGSPVAYYLAAAGVGRLGLLDGDFVENSNLHRQIIHFTPDVQKMKTASAKEKLSQLNPGVQVEVHPHYADPEKLSLLTGQYDFVIDATDNFTSKFMISDTCVQAGKAFCHAGVSEYSGQVFTYVSGRGCGCYRCLFTKPPAADILPDRADAGILGTVPGILGAIQATEAIKYLAGIGTLLLNRLLIYDAKEVRFRTLFFKPSLKCPWLKYHT
jgi:molybdopterin/thiamine biosynthesis adenylyltransferase